MAWQHSQVALPPAIAVVRRRQGTQVHFGGCAGRWHQLCGTQQPALSQVSVMLFGDLNGTFFLTDLFPFIQGTDLEDVLEA